MSDSAEHHRAFRRGLEHEVRRRRALLTLGQRLDGALRAAGGLSEAPTGTTEGVIARGKPGAVEPPVEAGLLFGPATGSVKDVFERRLRIMVELLEREVDCHLAQPTSDARETREEKDKRLVSDFEGEPSSMVSFIDPSMGSPRTVERARVRMKRRALDGRLLEDD